MLTTWLTERFELSVPVVSAPMAGVSGGELAGAVSAAGGLGMIGFAGGRAEDLRHEASLAKAAGRPFGIGLLAWVLDFQPELLDVALECGPALVSVSFGSYAPYVERVKAAGALFATQAGTVGDARAALVLGADLIVARGGEGGGHGRDAVGTLPLLQGVLDAVDVPVLAAGGVGTARGLAAVLAAGAAGAWVGTAFVSCPEATNTPAARAAVIAATELDTIYTRVLDLGRGVPWPEDFGGRALRNAFAERWHGREAELAAAGERTDEPVVWAGQSAGLVHAERPAAEVLRDFAGAEELLLAVLSRSR
ncbi:MAG: nitronate monooxygenase [Frankiaceae bacterium]|nr:nitronate monooxygenase [Frankiaceae bacterium]